MNNKSLVVILVLLLILSVGYIVYTSNKSSSPEPESAIVEKISKSFDALQSQIQDMQKDIAANQVKEHSKKKDEKPFSFQEMSKRAEDFQKLIDTTFEQEAVNADWSAMVTNAIKKAFQLPELADGKIADLDCRTTMCRLEITHDKTLKSNKRTLFENYLLIRLGKELPTARIQYMDKPEALVTIGYFVRKGYTLPDLNVGPGTVKQLPVDVESMKEKLPLMNR